MPLRNTLAVNGLALRTCLFQNGVATRERSAIVNAQLRACSPYRRSRRMHTVAGHALDSKGGFSLAAPWQPFTITRAWGRCAREVYPRLAQGLRILRFRRFKIQAFAQ